VAKQYMVRGKDKNSGMSASRVMLAESIAAAEQQASVLGIEVTSVDLYDPSKPVPEVFEEAPEPVARGIRGGGKDIPEETVWEDTPSQWGNLWWFVACIVVIPIPVAIWKYIETRVQRMTMTTQRLKLQWGVLNRHYDQVELYRVKDFVLERSFWQRAVGIGTVRMATSDQSLPEVVLKNITQPESVAERLRSNVERVRKIRGVRELDVSDDDRNVFA